MTLADVLRRRRMTRRFSGEVGVDWVVEQCDLARRAPSAGYAQGTHFLILSGEHLRRFWIVSGAGGWFGERQPGVLAASVVVLVLADPTAYEARYSEPDKAGHGLDQAIGWSVPYWLTDAAMAAQNLLLLIEEARLGALFFGLFVEPRRTLDAFGVPTHVDCVGAIAIGERASDDAPTGTGSRRSRRPLSDIAHLGTW
jgi:nitroreductase